MSDYTDTISHCRLCRKDSLETKLFKYGVRHYACATCGLKRWGREFLNMLPLHEAEQITFAAIQDIGITYKEMEKYVDDRKRLDLHVMPKFDAQQIAAFILRNCRDERAHRISWTEFGKRNEAAWSLANRFEPCIIGSACDRRVSKVQEFLRLHDVTPSARGPELMRDYSKSRRSA